MFGAIKLRNTDDDNLVGTRDIVISCNHVMLN